MNLFLLISTCWLIWFFLEVYEWQQDVFLFFKLTYIFIASQFAPAIGLSQQLDSGPCSRHHRNRHRGKGQNSLIEHRQTGPSSIPRTCGKRVSDGQWFTECLWHEFQIVQFLVQDIVWTRWGGWEVKTLLYIHLLKLMWRRWQEQGRQGGPERKAAKPPQPKLGCFCVVVFPSLLTRNGSALKRGFFAALVLQWSPFWLLAFWKLLKISNELWETMCWSFQEKNKE